MVGCDVGVIGKIAEMGVLIKIHFEWDIEVRSDSTTWMIDHIGMHMI